MSVTLLILSVSAGNLDIVKLLLKEGADITAKDNDYITALTEASIVGHVKVIKLLLKEGANVSAFSNSSVTIL